VDVLLDPRKHPGPSFMPHLVSIILTAILAADLLWWWHADRLARPLRHAFWWRLLLGLFMGGQVALVLWTFAGRGLVGSPLSRPPRVLSAAAYLWHLLILPAALTIVGTAGVLFRVWQSGRRLARLATTARRDTSAEAGPGAGATATRRQFLGALTAVTPALVTGGGVACSLAQLPRFRLRSMDLALPGLPPGLDGLRIALVSDLHVGTFTSGPEVRRIVEETSRQGADLVLLPGDLINNSLSDLSDALDAVNDMQSRHGSYLSLGNHDLIEDGAEFIRRTRARVPLLVDESRVVPIRGHHVQLLGLSWSLDEQRIAASVRQLASQITPGAFPILLAHHPHAFDAAAAAGIPLTVSGHTHGGQLMLTDSVGFGPLMYRYWSGLYTKPEHNGAALVVSNGVGNWFPVRTGAPAEIIHLTLRSAGGPGLARLSGC
jgi:predicted MPP superfamily phosphohydrolase